MFDCHGNCENCQYDVCPVNLDDEGIDDEADIDDLLDDDDEDFLIG